MKKLILALTLCLTACAKYPDPGGMQILPTILTTWVNPLSGQVLDLSQLVLNQEAPASLVVACDGNYGNAGKANGMERGNVELSGTTSDGLLSFGHLKYVGASDARCHDFSKEVYQYKVNADGSMRLCMKNYAYCADYVKVSL